MAPPVNRTGQYWNEPWLREMWVDRRTPVEVLAGICGCGVGQIYYALNQLNITRSRSIFNTRIAEDIRRLYCDEGLSSTVVAGRYGVHPVTMRSWLERAGIPRTHHRRTDPVCADTLRRLYWDRGMSLRQMGVELDATTGQIHGWMVKHGIPCRPAPGDRPEADSTYRDHDWVYERYVRRRMLVREVADEASCSFSTMRTWMRRLGIERRTRREQHLRQGFGRHDRIADGYLPMGDAALQEELRSARDAMAQWRMLEVYFPIWDRVLMSAQTHVGFDDRMALQSMRGDIAQLREALGWQDTERLYREDGHRIDSPVAQLRAEVERLRSAG